MLLYFCSLPIRSGASKQGGNLLFFFFYANFSFSFPASASQAPNQGLYIASGSKMPLKSRPYFFLLKLKLVVSLI